MRLWRTSGGLLEQQSLPWWQPLGNCLQPYVKAPLQLAVLLQFLPRLSAPLQYSACAPTRHSRREGKAQLQLAGAADPTGRGFGYSFVRDIRHKVRVGWFLLVALLAGKVCSLALATPLCGTSGARCGSSDCLAEPVLRCWLQTMTCSACVCLSLCTYTQKVSHALAKHTLATNHSAGHGRGRRDQADGQAAVFATVTHPCFHPAMPVLLQGMGADDVTKQMAKRQAGKVQGTDADLRRMTTAQAKERLRCGSGAACNMECCSNAVAAARRT